MIRKDIFGIYKALMRENIPVDFIHLSDLNTEKLRNYKIIFAPFSISLTESASNSLKEYVKYGGVLIADGRIAWTNDKGWLMDKIPGFSLDEVFGCIENYMTEVREPFDIEVKDFGKIKGINYLSSYTVTSGKVIGSYKNVPVIIENEYFKGKAIMIGTLFGLSIEAEFDENIDFIHKILRNSQVYPYFKVKSESEDVEVRCSKRENEGIFFVFNHSDNSQRI